MKKNRKRVLRYESDFEEYPDIVRPAKSAMPKWYKDAPSWDGDKKSILKDTRTFKLCSPFMDTFTTGYVVTLPFDLLVEQIEGAPYITWRGTKDLLRLRPHDIHDHLPSPHGYYPYHFSIICPFSFSVPDEYSVLFTHPINRIDLPFLTMTGVLDGGYVLAPGGNLPFFIREGFEGIIEQGTPFAQLIPFKREDWVAERTPGLLKEGQMNGKRSSALVSGWYKKSHWKKKTYN
jgi:hypothetical protein